MGFFSDLFSNSETVTAQPLLTKEQKEAMQALLNYGLTGRTPSGFQAGEAADLSGFNFDIQPGEVQAQNYLSALLGPQSGIATARNRLTDIANQEFDPSDPSTGFAAFQRQLSRATKEADDVINREAAIQGNRFGNRILEEKTDLAERQSDVIASQLGQLFNQQQNRALQASQALGGLEQTGAGIASQLFGVGGAQRDLQNAEAQLKYNDRQRQRDEQLGALTGLNTVFNRNVPYGVTSQEVRSPNLFGQLLGAAGTGLGFAAGGLAGGALANQFLGGGGSQAGPSVASLFGGNQLNSFTPFFGGATVDQSSLDLISSLLG